MSVNLLFFNQEEKLIKIDRFKSNLFTGIKVWFGDLLTVTGQIEIGWPLNLTGHCVGLVKLPIVRDHTRFLKKFPLCAFERILTFFKPTAKGGGIAALTGLLLVDKENFIVMGSNNL